MLSDERGEESKTIRARNKPLASWMGRQKTLSKAGDTKECCWVWGLESSFQFKGKVLCTETKIQLAPGSEMTSLSFCIRWFDWG